MEITFIFLEIFLVKVKLTYYKPDPRNKGIFKKKFSSSFYVGIFSKVKWYTLKKRKKRIFITKNYTHFYVFGFISILFAVNITTRASNLKTWTVTMNMIYILIKL